MRIIHVNDGTAFWGLRLGCMLLLGLPPAMFLVWLLGWAVPWLAQHYWLAVLVAAFLLGGGGSMFKALRKPKPQDSTGQMIEAEWRPSDPELKP